MLLLDASVWIAAKDTKDRYHTAAGELVLNPRWPVAALDLTLYETANVVGGRWGRPDVAGELCRTIVSRARELVAVDLPLADATLAIVAEHGLTAYDAAYVAVARRHDWTLVSSDLADLVSKGLAVAPDAADYP